MARRAYPGSTGGVATCRGSRPAGEVGVEIDFEYMRLRVPTAFEPNDPAYPDQWNLTQARRTAAEDAGTLVSATLPLPNP
jgi:hypothetical protein